MDTNNVLNNEKKFKVSRNLKASIIAILVILTAQGWTGDFTNLFAVFPTGTVAPSVSGILSALYGGGILPLYHALEGLALILISISILILSFRSYTPRSFRVCVIVGFAAIVSAAVGGILFVLSDFANNANSAQMGGSFIGAYAFYFLALYFTKN